MPESTGNELGIDFDDLELPETEEESELQSTKLEESLLALTEEKRTIEREGSFSDKQDALQAGLYFLELANGMAEAHRRYPVEFGPHAPSWAPQAHRRFVEAVVAMGERLRPTLASLAESVGEEIDLDALPDYMFADGEADGDSTSAEGEPDDA